MLTLEYINLQAQITDGLHPFVNTGQDYQFYLRGFDKHRIVWVDVMEYTSVDPKPMIKRLLELDSTDSQPHTLV